VLAENLQRMGCIITNDSDEVIYLALGEAAVLNQGIRLNANGGSFTMDYNLLSLSAINAISTSGSKNLCVVEF